MGRSISQAYYERFKKWQEKQNRLQEKFKNSYALEYLGGSNMKGILTAPEFNINYTIEKCRKCTIKEAQILLLALDEGTLTREGIIAWIKKGE